MSTTADAFETPNFRRHEIASFLGVCLQTVDRLIRENAFPSWKVGGQRLAAKKDVAAFNERMRTTAADAGPDIEAFELLAKTGHSTAGQSLHPSSTPEAAGTAAPSP